MSDDLILKHTEGGVTTLTMNNPRRLNGWTMPMMLAMRAALKEASADEQTAVVILTGAGEYYSAGVNLGALPTGAPKAVHAYIAKNNQAIFDAFLDFDKPILIAVNGPAIGAVVTSATLCDGIIASERATFSTPFARLGVPREGCSSVMFDRLMGGQATRMLDEEGWKPTAQEAKDAGLIQWVVPHDQLLDEARTLARRWIAEGKARTFRGGFTREELKAVNARESQQVATAFLSPPFLMGQFRFLWSKGKRGPALVFLTLRLTRPVWGLLL